MPTRATAKYLELQAVIRALDDLAAARFLAVTVDRTVAFTSALGDRHPNPQDLSQMVHAEEAILRCWRGDIARDEALGRHLVLSIAPLDERGRMHFDKHTSSTLLHELAHVFLAEATALRAFPYLHVDCSSVSAELVDRRVQDHTFRLYNNPAAIGVLRCVEHDLASLKQPAPSDIDNERVRARREGEHLAQLILSLTPNDPWAITPADDFDFETAYNNF